MVVFTCKYKCTIKGSELDVVLELHGHGLSWQTESSFVEHEARSTEQSLCLSAGGQNAEVFPCQPPQAWKLWPPWPQPIQRILPLVQSFLRKVLSLTSLLITFRSFHRRPKAVAKGRRLSSTLEFVLLMKPKDSLFQLGNLDWIAAVRFQQLLQGSHQRKDNWGGDKDVQLLQELYHHLYLSYVFLHDKKNGTTFDLPNTWSCRVQHLWCRCCWIFLWSKKGCWVALIFCEYSSTNIYSRASTNFWSDDYMAIILLKSATSNVQSNW